MVTAYCYEINDHQWLCVIIILQRFTGNYTIKLFNILHLIFGKLSLLFAYTHPSVFIATATANPPNTKNKSVKAPFTCDVWKV